MGYHPRVENSKMAFFQTTRSRCSELWFVNNHALEHDILGFAAKYAQHYKVKLYALAIEGNHIQFPALFPRANRAQFMRDFNSSVARAVPRHQGNHPGGRFWARRYSSELLPGSDDVEEMFFYTVLQQVQDGLVDDIRKYPGYNCFEDAIWGRSRKFSMVRWKEYHDARRWDPTVKVADFVDEFELRFERLPGYEHLSQPEYAALMREKLRERTAEILAERGKKGTVGAVALLRVKPGACPKRTKTSGPNDHRPRVICKNPARRAKAEAWYYSVHFRHRRASKRYREGKPNVRFPAGTYKPPTFTIASNRKIDDDG